MTTSREDIQKWLEEAPSCATHMLVVCDTFDYSDYPVYTDNVEDSVVRYQEASMQRVMEVYNLSLDFDIQVAKNRAWNI